MVGIILSRVDTNNHQEMYDAFRRVSEEVKGFRSSFRNEPVNSLNTISLVALRRSFSGLKRKLDHIHDAYNASLGVVDPHYAQARYCIDSTLEEVNRALVSRVKSKRGGA